MDYSKFDKEVDVIALAQNVREVEQNSGNTEFKEVPLGTYEVKVESMELKESKAGSPMVSIWFKILNGDYSNSIIFMNQVITKDFQIHIVNELLRSMKTNIDIGFSNYRQYGQLIEGVFDRTDNYEYALEYGEKKGFKTFRITEVFELE